MNNETIQIIIILSGIFGVTVLGLIFLWLSRCSRIKNEELKASGDNSPVEAYLSERRRGNVIEAIKAYFSGTVTRQEAILGKFLAFAVIIFVSAFLVLGCLIIMKSI